MLDIVLGTRGTARNKPKCLFSQSFHAYRGQTYNTGPHQYVHQQNSPKGGTHTTSEIWNCEGCTQTNTIIVTIPVYDYILFMAHKTGFPFVLA